MKLKKGDILYHYNWKDISDKDYCTEELTDKFSDCMKCPNYKKCLVQTQKLVLTKARFTKRTYWKYRKDVRHYNIQDLKFHKKQVGNFKNYGFTMSDKIYPKQLEEWRKSESAALTEVIKRLKKYTRRVKNAKEDDYLAFKDKRILEKLIALQEKLIKEQK